MEEVVKPGLLPQAFDLVRQHKQEGATVLVVTATNEFVTRPIAAALGADELLAIDLVRDTAPGGTGWFTTQVRGVPTFREGKVTRVEAWLAARNLGWQDVHSTFYSDSINDLPLLEKANVPVATNPDDPLRAIALERGWRILELFA
jgi:HAD superfamily hydrolase (TIGR01490 family)